MDDASLTDELVEASVCRDASVGDCTILGDMEGLGEEDEDENEGLSMTGDRVPSVALAGFTAATCPKPTLGLVAEEREGDTVLGEVRESLPELLRLALLAMRSILLHPEVDRCGCCCCGGLSLLVST